MPAIRPSLPLSSECHGVTYRETARHGSAGPPGRSERRPLSGPSTTEPAGPARARWSRPTYSYLHLRFVYAISLQMCISSTDVHLLLTFKFPPAYV